MMAKALNMKNAYDIQKQAMQRAMDKSNNRA
jgi:hypothetical protein